MSHDASWLQPVTLQHAHAALVPLSLSHLADLQDAARDGELWKLWYTFVPRPEAMEAEITTRLAHQHAGTWLPFAVISPATGRAVGMTNYLNVDTRQRRVEIGGTWYRNAVQRSPLNTACKLLLLGHAFEQLDCIAVEFRTHFFNHQSRRAIERLGAKLDGVLRNHQRMPDGTLRDTCVYSILPGEWPTVKAHLTHQLERAR